MTNKEKAETILRQLTRSDNPFGVLTVMAGCGIYGYDKDSVSFRFKGCKKANICKICIEADDTYSLTFFKIGVKDLSLNVSGNFSGIYADGLKGVFEDFTGLMLSL